jgi:hypothetical protein
MHALLVRRVLKQKLFAFKCPSSDLKKKASNWSHRLYWTPAGPACIMMLIKLL